jgi:hypothetical protein
LITTACQWIKKTNTKPIHSICSVAQTGQATELTLSHTIYIYTDLFI